MKTINIEIPKGYQIDEEKSTFTQIVFKPIEKKWIDLALPSGTLWCYTNEEGYYFWDEMNNTLDKGYLPKLTDFAELYDYCDWKWDDKKKGMWVIGINGNRIFFPASGWVSGIDGSLNGGGVGGLYWSASPSSRGAYNLAIYDNGSVNPSDSNYHTYGYSVRLIKRN